MPYNVILTEAALRDLVAEYQKQPAFAFDVETIGDYRVDPVRNEVLWISLACETRTDVIPMGHPNGEYIRTDYPLLSTGKQRLEKGLPIRPSDYSRDAKKATKIFGPPPEQLKKFVVFDLLRPLLKNPDIVKVGHNLKFDIKSVAKYVGGVPEGPFFCTMIASWVLDTRRTGSLSLAACLKREFSYDMEKGIGAKVEDYSFDEVAKYSALDSEWDFKLYLNLKNQLRDVGLHKVMKLEMDVLGAIAPMELQGAHIDQDALKTLYQQLEGEVEDAKADIYRIAGHPFNINSNKEKQQLLFGRKRDGGRGLRPTKFTAGGAPSVAAEALERFRDKDDLATAILTYADLNKLQSTYVLPYLGGNVERTTSGRTRTIARESLLVNGKIHTDFVQNGAETGRFSSRNPNLQNVPNARTEHGHAIRNLFYAPDGYSIVCADYSQIEPRVLTSFSQDPILHDGYMNGVDAYTSLASPLGLSRSDGKVLFLAMTYGIGPDKIESSIGLPPGAGKELLSNFEEQFKTVYKYRRRVIGEASNRGYVETLTGRRRYLPDLTSREFGLKMRAERQAFNTKIQGSAADIMKIAIVRASRMLPDHAHLILQVHDELVAICPEEMADEVASTIKYAMEGIHVLDIPLIAEVKVAKRWGDAK